jgi:essential nuclear protein 1
MSFNGPVAIFMKVLLEKKYALPMRVLNSIVNFFVRYENDNREMPVVWH